MIEIHIFDIVPGMLSGPADFFDFRDLVKSAISFSVRGLNLNVGVFEYLFLRLVKYVFCESLSIFSLSLSFEPT